MYVERPSATTQYIMSCGCIYRTRQTQNISEAASVPSAFRVVADTVLSGVLCDCLQRIAIL